MGRKKNEESEENEENEKTKRKPEAKTGFLSPK